VAEQACRPTSAARAGSPGSAAYDEKNIRRRVYDALNVLMAMDIISKDKKEIRWQGLPSTPEDRGKQLRAERAKLRARLMQQHGYLRARAPSRPASSLPLLLPASPDRPADAVRRRAGEEACDASALCVCA